MMYILFLLIVSCVASAIIVFIVDLFLQIVIPQMGYVFIVIAFFCRSMMVLSKEKFEELMRGEE